MSETNEKIIEMIKKNATANEIAKETGLSPKQLFYRLNLLKIKGYNFSRKYYYDGEITYKLCKGFEQEKDISLITRPKDTKFRAVFISDLHLSNEAERVDILNQVYDFCAKEGINIIINSGDILDGFLGSKNYKKIDSYEKQIEHLLNVYPYDKNILNFTCLGNHEYDALEKTGQNLETVLNIKRHDIIPLGYGIGRLKIKNDEIIVRHPQTPTSKPIETINSGLFIYGHSHRAKNEIFGNVVNLHIPSLSNMQFHENVFPGFIKGTIEFNNGIFHTGNFEQYIVLDKIYKVNETCYELFKGKNNSQVSIKYEEERKSIFEEQKEETKQKVLTNENRRLSQIEKFKKKYGE